MDLGLRGHAALVCASTAGLGRATAETLAAEGARVVINGRRAELAREIADGLPGAVAVPGDLAEPEAAEKLVAAARRELDAEIDILVLNGPGPKPGGAADISVDDTRAALESLLLTHQELVSGLLPGMRERGWGRILAIGSYGVVEPLSGLALSNMGRAALVAYLKTLAAEVAGDGVTVNMVIPGRIDTDRVRSLDAHTAEAQGREVAEIATANAASIPAGRYGTPAEFGALAAFLCSAQAGYITGTATRCDGGIVRHL